MTACVKKRHLERVGDSCSLVQICFDCLSTSLQKRVGREEVWICGDVGRVTIRGACIASAEPQASETAQHDGHKQSYEDVVAAFRGLLRRAFLGLASGVHIILPMGRASLRSFWLDHTSGDWFEALSSERSVGDQHQVGTYALRGGPRLKQRAQP